MTEDSILCKAEGLRKSYHGRCVVNDATLYVRPGEGT